MSLVLPKDIFVDVMKRYSINSICSCVKGIPKASWRSPINRLVNILLYKPEYALYDETEEGKIVEEYKGFYFLKKFSGSGIWGDLILLKKRERIPYEIFEIPEEFFEEYNRVVEDYPVFIIDMKFWNLMTDEEKFSLLNEIQESVGLIRDYLVDDCLIITNISKETLQPYVEKKGYFDILERVKQGFYTHYLDLENTIVLDPYGDEELTEDDIRSYKFFIIGGIVDKGNRLKGITRKLVDFDVPHKKISLFGKLTGVPEEINHIIHILLKVLVEDKSLEEAIIDVQPKRYKIQVARELIRFGYSLDEISEKLKIPTDELKKWVKEQI